MTMFEQNLLKEKYIIGQSIDDMESLAQFFGSEKYRGGQLFDWIYRKQEDNITKMTDLSVSFRKKLISIPIHPLKLISNNKSDIQKTKKFLFELNDGNKIESVLMNEGKRITVCLSTQVGCAMDCNFCATAKMGFYKNLTAGEIVDQFLQLQKLINKKITNVVFMGMGEPFHNYNNTIAAADLLHHNRGINMGAWRITISTVGIVPKIIRYAKEKHPYKLAISLNGSDNNQRLMTMPITKTHSFEDLINAAKDYISIVNKRVTFEYVLMENINDKPMDSKKLKDLLSPINCKLNIIPYNDIDSEYKRPDNDAIGAFLKPLKKAPFPVTIRWSKGIDIDAGCGQLAINSK